MTQTSEMIQVFWDVTPCRQVRQILTDLLEELGASIFIDPEEGGTILVQKSVDIYKVTLCNISEVLEVPLAQL